MTPANRTNQYNRNDQGDQQRRPARKKKKTGRIIRRIFLVLGIMISATFGIIAATLVHRGERALGMINYNNKNTLAEVDLSKYKLASDKQVINILLVGADKNEDEQSKKGAERRSDSMMIATLDIKHKKLKLTSMMRDMYVQVPGYGNQKLNAAYSYGGVQLLYETLAQNFGVKMDGYGEVNFDSFVNVIDQLGGVEVNLTESEQKAMATATWVKRKKYRNCKVGKQTFNGIQALGYCRMRHGQKLANGRYLGAYTASGKGDDFGRVERQRLTIQAILKKVKKLSINEVLTLAENILPGVTTDIPKDDLYAYLVNIVQMGTSKIHQFSLPADNNYKNQTIGGQQVLVTDIASNKAAFKKFLYNS
ncbi:MAG: LCP family protein [Eubacterium sp.]|nr:LCP family protein [Eubacterium sp.]